MSHALVSVVGGHISSTQYLMWLCDSQWNYVILRNYSTWTLGCVKFRYWRHCPIQLCCCIFQADPPSGDSRLLDERCPIGTVIVFQCHLCRSEFIRRWLRSEWSTIPTTDPPRYNSLSWSAQPPAVNFRIRIVEADNYTTAPSPSDVPTSRIFHARCLSTAISSPQLQGFERWRSRFISSIFSY